MSIQLNPDAPFEDEKVWNAIHKIGREIAADANRTEAKIGITARRRGRGRDRKIVITSRGAPAVALEFGTATQPAKRYVKRALDKARIR